ncbi:MULTISPECIES: cytochrome b/b6 domain-containing protein [Alphaproteobacteria]|uniref:Cytochrome b561 n=2 Tax=Alphaproteobacteria TaxID=28211 RepID=A0A512HF24_9HYPH|nr:MULTISPECIES: cytochrome b/b6 domain-containing protein [Alphaproteobacteria]GEO84059.1 cytochrome b561 [Ciceribacter naphthalenivorans]GLR21063.1 cytochrome b561 [Ciceribacter naphthalenivorans]GLT03919.1 cytochrome b561 [Sphingomonas psychrolutea]
MSEATQELHGAHSVRSTRTEWVKVWDPLVRIFHWSLVGLFVFSYLTGDEWKSAHIVSGYLIAGLLTVRVIWGLFGTEHARFRNFIYHPGTVLKFLADTARMRAQRYLGHNPAGGAMVIALLVSIASIATTGYMMTTDAFWGVEWVEDAHKTLVNVTLGLIALHVAGVALASLEHRENLVRAMLNGRKRGQ